MCRINDLIFYFIFLISVVLTQAESCHSETSRKGSHRVLNLTSPMLSTEINHYYHPDAHGPTKKFFEFSSEGVVIVAHLNNNSLPIALHLTVYVFREDATPQSISHWINNQHSDGLYVDAAQPVRSFPIKDDYISSELKGPLTHEVIGPKESYDKYEVTFTVQDFTDSEIVFQKSEGTATVYVRNAPMAR